jgi:hypothetical protein
MKLRARGSGFYFTTFNAPMPSGWSRGSLIGVSSSPFCARRWHAESVGGRRWHLCSRPVYASCWGFELSQRKSRDLVRILAPAGRMK